MEIKDFNAHGLFKYFSCFLLMLVLGCDQQANLDKSTKEPQSSEILSNNSWPRSVETKYGTFTLTAPPQRIVSGSVTLTGHLLTLDAPVVGSGATQSNVAISGTQIADENGFFIQWADKAKERGIVPLYQLEPNAEAILAMNPDLIILSESGGDNSVKLLEQLKNVAPVYVVNYYNKGWEDITKELAYILDKEDKSKEVIASYYQKIAEVKDRINYPPQPVSVLGYFLDGRGLYVFTEESSQGDILTKLGFQLALPPSEFLGKKNLQMSPDSISISGEKMGEGITGQSLFVLAATSNLLNAISQNPFLKDVEAIKNQHFYSLGPDSFRMDFYSSMNMINRIDQEFGHKP